jgi:hypothetical protein
MQKFGFRFSRNAATFMLARRVLDNRLHALGRLEVDSERRGAGVPYELLAHPQ